VKNRDIVEQSCRLVILNLHINFNQHTSPIYQDSNPGSRKHKTITTVPHTRRSVLQKLHITQSATPSHRQSIIQSTTYLQSTTFYTECLLELLYAAAVWSDNRNGPGTERLVWTPASDPVFISSRSNSRTTPTKKILISLQRPQMSSAVNIRMAFIA